MLMEFNRVDCKVVFAKVNHAIAVMTYSLHESPKVDLKGLFHVWVDDGMSRRGSDGSRHTKFDVSIVKTSINAMSLLGASMSRNILRMHMRNNAFAIEYRADLPIRWAAPRNF